MSKCGYTPPQDNTRAETIDALLRTGEYSLEYLVKQSDQTLSRILKAVETPLRPLEIGTSS